jgi:hypothetical protein
MADNNSNIIQPVDGLQNIASLTPAERRKDRKRRQQLNQESKQNPDTENQPDNPIEEQYLHIDQTDNENEQSNTGGIDYCA